MTQPIAQQSQVFPRWYTAGVIVGFLAVMGWITHFVGVTAGLV